MWRVDEAAGSLCQWVHAAPGAAPAELHGHGGLWPVCYERSTRGSPLVQSVRPPVLLVMAELSNRPCFHPADPCTQRPLRKYRPT